MRRLLHPNFVPTLRLTRPLGQTLALTFLILLLLIALAEILSRVPAITEHWPSPGLGLEHGNFESKLLALENVARQKRVDCLFLGSSVVLNSLDPAWFEEAYQAQTGETIYCFNFGVAATTASWSGVIVDYLIETYHPRLIIYGLSMRDFSPVAVRKGYTSADLLDEAWMQYQRKTVTVKGWLIDHSAAYRLYLPISSWTDEDFNERLARRRASEDAFMTRRGYRSEPGILTWPLSPAEHARISDLFLDYAPMPEELEGLRHIIACRRLLDVPILLVEVPLHPRVVTDYLGEDTYQQFNTLVTSYAASGGVLYWPTTQLNLIPERAWANANHVNRGGAKLFSRWLGEQVGQAVLNGSLVLGSVVK